MADVSETVTVAAPAQTVYAMVSDVTRVGEWSPETVSGHWLGGATAPDVGVRFKGTNRKGLRRWSTTCTVTAADAGRRFAFRVAYGPLPIAEWSYELEPTGGGCRVTESFTDRRAEWMRRASGPIMGVTDRAAHNREGMRTTLAAVKATAEREAAGA